MKALKGPNLVGLAMGGPAPGESLAIDHDDGAEILAIQPSPAEIPDANLSEDSTGIVGGASRTSSSQSEPQAGENNPAAALNRPRLPEEHPVLDLLPEASEKNKGSSLAEGSPLGGAAPAEGQAKSVLKASPESSAERRRRLMSAASSAAEEAEAAQEPAKHAPC